MAEQGNFFRDSLARTLPGGPTGRQGPNTALQMLGQFAGNAIFPGAGGAGAELGERLGDTAFGRFVNNPMQGIRNFFGGNKPGYAGRDNTYTGQQGSNFVGPGQHENTGGYGTTAFAGSPASGYLGHMSRNYQGGGSQGSGFTPINLDFGQGDNSDFNYLTGSNQTPQQVAAQRQANSRAPVDLSGGGSMPAGMVASFLENQMGGGWHDRSQRLTPRREMSQDMGTIKAAGFKRQPGQTMQEFRNKMIEQGII